MATYEFNDQIKFLLPSGFMLTREENDDGEEVIKIISGEYENDDGETCYKFSCNVTVNEFDPDDVDDDITSANLLDKLAERMEDSRRLKLPGTPEAVFINKGTPISIFGRLLKMFACICLVRTSDWSTLQLVSVTRMNDDEPEENSVVYENMYEVLKAVRINGKKVPVESVSPYMLQDALELSFDENGEAIDVSPKIQFNFTSGDETTTYEYTQDGMKEVGKERLSHASPDESLYPHYNSMLSAGGLGFLGANVVVNASGTEYQFIPFSQSISDSELSEDTKALYSRIISKDTERYDLHEKAKAMQPIFHVNESVFDPRHDRECELEEGLMHRAYMMSALRSFAWTLADYCQEHGCTPDDVGPDVACRIANFVANENWLNYDGDSYCQGLCSGSDLHVFFIPDSVTKTDKKKLMPSQEDVDRVQQMKEKFPAYREILSEVHSLNALRKDLKYIYPAVKQLWEHLKEDRDYDEALLGNEADILYAWCALALAAKEPFFSEDGPMTCYFSQITDEETLTSRWMAAAQESAERAASQWMDKYGGYLERNPDIDFNGKLFAFSGLAGHGDEREHPTVQKVIEKGGQYRSKVSGLTNYLVVNPSDAGSSKIIAVMEQRQKGKDIKVILLSDLEAALDGTKTSKSVAATNTTKKKTEKAAVGSVPKGKKVPKKSCEIDDENRLTGYNGSEKHIILPQGIEIIGENAFMSSEIESVVVPEGVEKIEDSGFWGCKSLKSVTLPSSLRVIEGDAFRMCEELESIVIPEGVDEIGMDAFTSCSKLKDIYLPNSLWDIGYDAFCTFCDDMTLHVPRGSDAETYAKDNELKYDNKKAPTATATVTAGKPSTAKKASAPAKPIVRTTSSASEFTIKDGMLTGYSGTATDIIIPAGVTEVDSFVFFKNESIVSLVIPEGVRKIDNCAFGYCPNLERVVFPESLEVLAGFNACEKLSAIELPPNVKVIKENAFSRCEKLEKIIIPSAVTSIESCAIDAGKALKDVYIPASVQDIHDYALLCSNNATIHTPAGSYAEGFAKRRNISCDNNIDGIWKIDSGEPTFGNDETICSANDESASDKNEKNSVNMFVILTNEWKLKKLNRSADEFYEIYWEEFTPLTKAEVIYIKQNVLAEMKDKSRCAYYATSFRKRSVQERFSLATRNLNSVGTEPEVATKAAWAIKNTKEWYRESELPEVINLMKEDLAQSKANLDLQLERINASWKIFATAKEYLQIVVSNKKTDNADLKANCSNFQIVIGEQLVQVKIATKEKVRRSTTLMDCFPWYWGVSARDIWETAIRNELYDTRKHAYNGQELANQALSQIRAKYPVAKNM